MVYHLYIRVCIHTSGEFMAIFDDDDYYSPEYLGFMPSDNGVPAS